MMRLFVFYGLLFGLFGIYLSQYLTLCREAYKLWLQEIVYGRHTTNATEKPELFSKIESLAKELCRLADAISFLFTILCITFFITFIATILKLESIKIGGSNETANIIISDSLSSNVLNNSECIILVASLILSTILFCSLPRILGYVRINIIHPERTSKVDEKLFDVWYKYKCFEYKSPSYEEKLQPTRLYQILSCRADEKKTFDGKVIEIPDEIKPSLEKLKKKKNWVCKKDIGYVRKIKENARQVKTYFRRP